MKSCHSRFVAVTPGSHRGSLSGAWVISSGLHAEDSHWLGIDGDWVISGAKFSDIEYARAFAQQYADRPQKTYEELLALDVEGW